MNKRIIVKFEMPDPDARFGRAEHLATSLHEALCQAIHEGGEDALTWLFRHVADIDIIGEEGGR